MIKGLYFKLNQEKQCDKEIYKFFINETKRTGVSKISLLYAMMCIYKGHENLEAKND